MMVRRDQYAEIRITGFVRKRALPRRGHKLVKHAVGYLAGFFWCRDRECHGIGLFVQMERQKSAAGFLQLHHSSYTAHDIRSIPETQCKVAALAAE